MISIVVPVYNKEEYIKETIESVLSQTYRDFEAIFVNDGSTDSSVSVLERFKDERIRIINIKNSGVALARNTGIQAAKYEYIAFLDADDWWDKDFLKETTNLIQQYPKNRVFSTGKSKAFGETFKRYNNRFLPRNGETGIIDYIEIISESLPPLHASSAVINKQLLMDVGLFKAGQKKHEDHDIWLRLCMHEDIVFSNTNLAYYRKGISNSSSSGKFSARDFKLYLETILLVKQSLSANRKLLFKKYYDKFIILTFIIYQPDYTRSEIKELTTLILKILDFPLSYLIKILSIMPFKRELLSVLKSLKK